MYYSHRYRLNPTPAQKERLTWTLDTCRQIRNHFLHHMSRIRHDLWIKEKDMLPDLKQWWADLREVHSKVLQEVVRRLYKDHKNLVRKRKKG